MTTTAELALPHSRVYWWAQVVFWLAVALLLPRAFHAFELSGRIYLPMHIPVLFAGFLTGGMGGLVVGLCAPVLSHLMTGMPPLYAVPLMTLELAAYGFLAGWLYRGLRLNVVLALVISMVAGRVIFGLTLFILGLFIEMPYSAASWFASLGGVATSWPGMLIQLFLIPAIVVLFKRFSGNS